MPDMQQQPAAPANAANAAVNAQLDAALEIEAKKAALQAIRQQAGGSTGGDAAAPSDAEAPVTITVNRGGETIELVNPSADQLSTVLGMPLGAKPPVEGWMLVSLTGMIVWGAVAGFGLWVWYRRSSRPAVRNTDIDVRDLTARMQRIESAIESVAVEVERVAENQRFASKLLSEGAARPVAVPLNTNVPVGHAAGDHLNG